LFARSRRQTPGELRFVPLPDSPKSPYSSRFQFNKVSESHYSLAVTTRLLVPAYRARPLSPEGLRLTALVFCQRLSPIKSLEGELKCHYCRPNGYSYRMMLSSATQITVGSRVTSSLLALVTLVQRTTIGISGLIAPPPF
jgi:hypothetical protein